MYVWILCILYGFYVCVLCIRFMYVGCDYVGGSPRARADLRVGDDGGAAAAHFRERFGFVVASAMSAVFLSGDLRFSPFASSDGAAVSSSAERLSRIACTPGGSVIESGAIASLAASPTRVAGASPTRASPSSVFPSSSREVVGTSSSARSAAIM